MLGSLSTFGQPENKYKGREKINELALETLRVINLPDSEEEISDDDSS